MKSMSSVKTNTARTLTASTASLLADAWAHIVMVLQSWVASRRVRRHFPKSTHSNFCQHSFSARLYPPRSGKRELRCGRVRPTLGPALQHSRGARCVH